MISLIAATAVLVIASLLAGYWHNDLFNGCRTAVLTYCGLAAYFENRHPAFTVAGLTTVVWLYASFFVICLVLKMLRNYYVAHRNRRLAEVYEQHHA